VTGSFLIKVFLSADCEVRNDSSHKEKKEVDIGWRKKERKRRKSGEMKRGKER
jgi:hypothetical protein